MCIEKTDVYRNNRCVCRNNRCVRKKVRNVRRKVRFWDTLDINLQREKQKARTSCVWKLLTGMKNVPNVNFLRNLTVEETGILNINVSCALTITCHEAVIQLSGNFEIDWRGYLSSISYLCSNYRKSRGIRTT